MKTTSAAAAFAGLLPAILAAPAPEAGCRTIYPSTDSSPAVVDCGHGLSLSSRDVPTAVPSVDYPGPYCRLENHDDYSRRTGCFCYNCDNDDTHQCYFYDYQHLSFWPTPCGDDGWPGTSTVYLVPRPTSASLVGRAQRSIETRDKPSKLYEDRRQPQMTSTPDVLAVHQRMQKNSLPPAKIALSDFTSLVSRVPPQPISSTYLAARNPDGILDSISSGISTAAGTVSSGMSSVVSRGSEKAGTAVDKVTSAGKEVPSAASKVGDDVGDIFTRI